MEVLLVDGVGNAVIYERRHDCLTITLPHTQHAFLKTEEQVDSRPVYRLRGTDGTVRIRHVHKHLSSPSKP